MIKDIHIKRLEKISKALTLIDTEFGKLMRETERFDYHSNSTFAENRLSNAEDIVRSLYEDIKSERLKTKK